MKGSITLTEEQWMFIYDQLGRVMDFDDSTDEQLLKRRLQDKIIRLVYKLQEKRQPDVLHLCMDRFDQIKNKKPNIS